MVGRNMIAFPILFLSILVGCGETFDESQAYLPEESPKTDLVDHPTVVLTIPMHDDAVEPTAILRVIFSAPMDMVAAAAALHVGCSGAEVRGNLAWDTTTEVLAFAPFALLPTGECQLEIAATAKSRDGVSLAEPYGQCFVVVDPAVDCKPEGC